LPPPGKPGFLYRTQVMVNEISSEIADIIARLVSA
jgi:hypothetical protein